MLTRAYRPIHRVEMQRQHGHATRNAPSPEYNAWRALIQRCTNPRNPGYADYGGRGIRVCRRWLRSFSAFLADVGRRPTSQHTLERSNNDHGYEPGNVVWATRAEQLRNTRRTRHLTHDGRTQCLVDWAIELGIKPRALRARLDRGWTVEQALTIPLAPLPARSKIEPIDERMARQPFGTLTNLRRTEGRDRWMADCTSCGGTWTGRGSALTTGNTSSCGRKGCRGKGSARVTA